MNAPLAYLRRIAPARGWLLAGAVVVVAATLLRLLALDLRPLHHDEGVNGYFVLNLVRNRSYSYDPANYHGPTLYYFALLAAAYSSLFFGSAGLNTIAIRSVPAVFGIAAVWLVLLLARFAGRTAAMLAAILLAVSPGAVFFSRYFIHESLLVFFTLGIVCAALWYRATGRSRFMVLAWVSAAFLFATKETAVITAAVLAFAAVASRGFVNARAVRQASRVSRGEHPGKLPDSGPPPRLRALRRDLLFGIALFAAVLVLLYSTFFLNPRGVADFLRSFQIWGRTAGAAHLHPWDTYFVWLWRAEGPLVCLCLAVVPFVLIRGDRFGAFAALWASGTILAYSLISYKSPWLCLNMILPMTLLAGSGLQTLLDAVRRRYRAALYVAFAAVACAGLVQTIDLNFRDYDDDARPYIYAHTRREFLALVGQLERLAQAAGGTSQIKVTVASPEYWPLPWYLRDFRNVGYPGKLENPHDDVIITSQKQAEDAQRLLPRDYSHVGRYPMRGGVDLDLFARKPLAAAIAH